MCVLLAFYFVTSSLLITLVLLSEMDQLVLVAASMGLLHSGTIEAQKEFCKCPFFSGNNSFPEEGMQMDRE